MAFSFQELLICALVLFVPLYLFIQSRRSRNPLVPTDWPVVGMLPFVLGNLHKFHDTLTILLASSGRNFEVRGPSVSNMDFLLTCDPANVRHIFTTNFANFPKGEEFASVFGFLGGTIFTADGEPWRRQRARIQYVLTRPQLLASVARCCREKLAGGLIPLLARLAETRTPFDMQDLLGRLVFDMTVMLVFGWDPRHLSADMTHMHVAAALDAIMEVAFYRQSVPVSCWKVMRRLNVGWERKLAAAEPVLRGFVAERLIQRRMAGHSDDVDGGGGKQHAATEDILSHYINDPDFLTRDGKPTEFLLNKTLVNYMVAFRDPVGAALPWVFYNLATNTRAMLRIREELAPIAARKPDPTAAAAVSGAGMTIFEPEETKDLLYLRAALFESLRLFPSGPIGRKAVLADDVLPSGHKVRGGDTVLVSVYGMGRLEDVWGDDCREYRPERWLSEEAGGGKLRHVQSYKFMAFNTGPRSCLGKNIAVAQITFIVATLLWNCDVEMLEREKVEPTQSVILQMKNGLMVKVSKIRGKALCSMSSLVQLINVISLSV